jgi:hypothetical protein
MAYGFKSGGRLPGTPNKKTIELEGLVEQSLGMSVPEALLEIFHQEANKDAKVRILLELMPYLYPKRKSIEATEVVADDQQSRLLIQFSDSVSKDKSSSGNDSY